MEIVLAFVLAAAGIFAAWYFWWKPPPHQSSKPDQFDVPIWNRVGEWSYMPLHEAARILYEKIRHTTLAAAAEWDSSLDGILDWCGVWIAKTKKTLSMVGARLPPHWSGYRQKKSTA